jgi:hypothetical protein
MINHRLQWLKEIKGLTIAVLHDNDEHALTNKASLIRYNVGMLQVLK